MDLKGAQVKHADWSARVVVETDLLAWPDTTSRDAGDKLLERVDGVMPSSTRMEKYEPGAPFPPPAVDQGEEILVLEGMLMDEHAEHAAGAYLRYPPGAQRMLHSEQGCVLFVKRYPFDSADSSVVKRDTANMAWLPGMVSGLSVLPLHQHQHEHVALVRWQPDTYFQQHAHFGGEEILVLSGVFEDEFGHYPAGTWIRSPHMSRHQPYSRTGCTIYVKTGHLLGP
jgi:anti-sigma factor ChrR (cupin superfamily)